MSGRCNQHTRRDALKTVPATTPGGAIRSSIQGPAFFLQPCTPHPPPPPQRRSMHLFSQRYHPGTRPQQPTPLPLPNSAIFFYIYFFIPEDKITISRLHFNNLMQRKFTSLFPLSWWYMDIWVSHRIQKFSIQQ